jgi:hypothetical protein
METVTINLIDGDFNLEDAREILIDLINKKIQFHSLKSHENWERSGSVDTNGHNRIKKLEEARNQILELTNANSSKEAHLRISSFIHISEMDGI